MESFWREYLRAKYLKLKHLLPFWPEFIQAKPAIIRQYNFARCLFVVFKWQFCAVFGMV
jgi:hypothetical protein